MHGSFLAAQPKISYFVFLASGFNNKLHINRKILQVCGAKEA